MTTTAQLINQDSGDTEYYTPIEIINSARNTMGVIDLDVASSSIANERVGAINYFTEVDNSLTKDWIGNIWMNHPFSRINNKVFIEKLVGEYDKGNITQACCITFAATSEKWFQPLFRFPQCFMSPRTNYFLPDGTLKKGVTKGSVVTYLGDNVEEFKKQFKRFGNIK